MGATLSVVKTLLIPAVIALTAYLVLTFVVVPLFQFYHNRYSHYLPLDAIASQTTSLRQRLQAASGRFLTPAAWSQRLHDRIAAGSGLGFGGGILGRSTANEDLEFLEDEDDYDNGEELGEIPRGGIGLPRGSADDGAYNTSRLSRDLEQGFMDDSEDEEPPARRR